MTNVCISSSTYFLVLNGKIRKHGGLRWLCRMLLWWNGTFLQIQMSCFVQQLPFLQLAQNQLHGQQFMLPFNQGQAIQIPMQSMQQLQTFQTQSGQFIQQVCMWFSFPIRCWKLNNFSCDCIGLKKTSVLQILNLD